LRDHATNIHVRIQAFAMLTGGGMEHVHAEYTIPLTRLPVDLLSSASGEMWEIKPLDDRAEALLALTPRLAAMNTAKVAGLLQGMNPMGMPYDWNLHPLRWQKGFTFPREVFLGYDATGWWEFYAGQAEAGVILWWKRMKPKPIPVPVPWPIRLPDRVTWSKRNTLPEGMSEPAPVPVPAFQPTFPSCPSTRSNGIQIDPVTGVVIIGGVAGVGVTIWWAAKVLSPLCGPAAPVCAIVF